MSKVLITGTSQGIGKAVAECFLACGHQVFGIDRQPSSIENVAYVHFICDVRDYENLPDIDGVEILINNAGTRNGDDIDVNLKALIHITEKYGVQENIKSILNIGSASAHTGSEFPEYCASKGGVVAYTKNVALRVSSYGATCNSLDPGWHISSLSKTHSAPAKASLWTEANPSIPISSGREYVLFPDAVSACCSRKRL